MPAHRAPRAAPHVAQVEERRLEGGDCAVRSGGSATATGRGVRGTDAREKPSFKVKALTLPSLTEWVLPVVPHVRGMKGRKEKEKR